MSSKLHRMTGWEATERVLDSGGFESRQRVLVDESVVDASESGARVLGVTYWQAVDRFTRGGVRASWSAGEGTLRLLGGVTLLTFGPPVLSFENDEGLLESLQCRIQACTEGDEDCFSCCDEDVTFTMQVVRC